MPMQTKQQSLNLFKYRQTIGYVYLMTYVSGDTTYNNAEGYVNEPKSKRAKFLFVPICSVPK